jgi:hypothetical protein
MLSNIAAGEGVTRLELLERDRDVRLGRLVQVRGRRSLDGDTAPVKRHLTQCLL